MLSSSVSSVECLWGLVSYADKGTMPQCGLCSAQPGIVSRTLAFAKPHRAEIMRVQILIWFPVCDICNKHQHNCLKIWRSE